MAKFERVDRVHNVYQCNRCGTMHQFEADGVVENGFKFCPYCGEKLRLPEEHHNRFVGLGENRGLCVSVPEAMDYALAMCGVTLDKGAPDAEQFREEFLRDFVEWYFLKLKSDDWVYLYDGEDEEEVYS